MNKIRVGGLIVAVVLASMQALSCSEDKPSGPSGIVTSVSLENDTGTSLDIVLTITNTGDRSLKLAFGSSQIVGYRVLHESGSVVDEFPVNRSGIGEVMTFPAHEEREWRMRILTDQLRAGRYFVSAGLLDHENVYPWKSVEYIKP